MTECRRQPAGLVEAFGRAAAQPLTLLTTVLLAGACADADTTGDRWAETRDMVATIEVVRNPAKPLRQADQVTVAELWDAANTGPRGIWESPRAIAVGTGTVYVLDEQAHSVYRLEESTGADLGTIGRRGAGPGEFERPFTVDVVDGHLMVGSRAGPRIDLFTAEGAYERRLRIDFLVFGIEAQGDDRLLLTGMEEGSGVTRLVDLDGDVEPFEPAATSVVDTDLAFDACPRWGGGASGPLRQHCRRLAFQQIALDGSVVREVHVDRSPELASAAELDAFEERMRRSLEEANIPSGQADALIDDELARARVKAVYLRIRGDRATGRVYVQEQTPPELGGGPASLNAFAADGRYLARLKFEHPWRDFQVRDDRLFALAIDPGTGLGRVIAYRLALPEGIRSPLTVP